MPMSPSARVPTKNPLAPTKYPFAIIAFMTDGDGGSLRTVVSIRDAHVSARLVKSRVPPAPAKTSLAMSRVSYRIFPVASAMPDSRPAEKKNAVGDSGLILQERSLMRSLAAVLVVLRL